MTRMTAMIIQGNGDIRCEASGPLKDKWAGWISLWRDGRPHIAPLLSTEFQYDSAAEAVVAMEQIVAEVRKQVA